MNLFDTLQPTAAARRTDPRTSHEAAELVESTGTAADHRAMILQAIHDGPGRTSGELAASLGLTNVQTSRRLPELERDNLIHRGKARTCKHKGTSMLTWWAGGAA